MSEPTNTDAVAPVEMDPAAMAAFSESLARGGGLAGLQPFLANMVSSGAEPANRMKLAGVRWRMAPPWDPW